MGAFPTRSPANRKQGGPLSLLPTTSLHISGRFCLFLQSKAVLLNLNTIRRHDKNLNAFSGSSPIFTLSNYITLAKLQLVRQSLQVEVSDELPKMKWNR
jgi:hypothetical protein